MNESPLLYFCDPAEAHSEPVSNLGVSKVENRTERSRQVHREAAPELRRRGVLQNSRLVVEAAVTQWPASDLVAFNVLCKAGSCAAVHAKNLRVVSGVEFSVILSCFSPLLPSFGTVHCIGQDRFCRRTGQFDNFVRQGESCNWCAHPILLAGRMESVDLDTGERNVVARSADQLDGTIMKPCGNRRESFCPSCASLYRSDARHLVRAGLTGEKAHCATKEEQLVPLRR